MKMMNLAPLAAALALAAGPVAAADCELNGTAPTMPDPATATDEEISATIASIKAFQAALGEYRACLESVADNTELEKDTRNAALKAFNESVDAETAMVEDWQAFQAALNDAQG